MRWYTLKTPHFHIHFHSGLEEAAQRTANLAEAIQRRLYPNMRWVPSEPVQVVLSDDSDAANGSATALPYNTIRLFMTAPDDMSPLGDYDDWLLELITHEHTHVLHVDNITGLPALYNAILGKSLAPNQAQPRWILEGLAVAMESAHTSGGRVRSTQFDMYLRADVLADNIASLDEISHTPRRWPSGNLWYLYGGKFIDWILRVYGPETYAVVAADYGQNPLAWGINRSIRRATGRTYPELYKGFIAHLKRAYAAQIAAAQRRGLREGKQLTHGGRVAATARFVPSCGRKDGREALLYFRDDGDQPAGFYRVPLKARDRAENEGELLIRSNGQTANYLPNCDILYDNTAPSARKYYFSDLFLQPHDSTAPRGIEHTRRRLTTGRRARDPNVSRDGRRITYITNRAGTTTLRIADLTAEGQLEHERILVPSARYEQAFTPRFSPDGSKVAYSVWTYGGYRDIRVADVRSGRFYELAHDRAMDQQPTWSADGKLIYFASDRTGIANIFAYEIATGDLYQVTNVKIGAYMPELSPDGRTLIYVGYTTLGFDLFSMPLDRSKWLAAEPYVDRRPASPPAPPRKRYPVSSYNPLPTLRPRSYQLDYAPGPFGQALKVTASGNDAVGIHGFIASITVEEKHAEPSASLDYFYRRLPFDMRASVFRSAVPRSGFRYSDQAPIVTEYITGATTGIGYGMPGEFDAQSMSLSYTVARYEQKLPLGEVADPYAEVIREPHHGTLGLLRLGYSYSNATATVNAISAERGMAFGVAGDFATPELGSDDTLTAFSARWTGYLPMPWLKHHVLALHLGGAAAVGTYPRRGLYFTGGFLDLPLLDAYTSGIRQGGFVLRGYEPAQFIGSQYNLLNAEYRFPIAYVDRGISTLPVFLNTVSGNLFADYGGAFNRMDLDDPLESYHLGVGAELWIDLTLGYFVRGNIRLGHARGVDDEFAVPGGQTYVVVSAPF